VYVYASLSYGKQNRKGKYGQGSGEGLVNFPKAHYLLWEQGEIKRKKHNEIVFATKAHTYSCTPADLTLTWKLRHVGQTRGGWAAFPPSSSYLPVNGPTEKYETWTCCYLSLVWFFVATASPRYKWRCRYRYWRANTDTAHNQQQTQIHLHRYSMKCSKWLCGCKSGSWRMLRYVLRPIPPLDFMIKFYSFPQLRLTLWHLQLQLSDWATHNCRKMLPRTSTFPKRFHHVSCI